MARAKRHVARPAEAADASDARGEGHVRGALRQPAFKHALDAFRRRRGRKLCQLSPKLGWIALRAKRHFAQRRMTLLEHEWVAAGFEIFGIALEHDIGSSGVVDGESVLALGEDGARDQANEIDGIGHAGDFIEIIDAPDETSLSIAPRSEILHVQIADRNHPWRLGEVGTRLPPQGGPAIERPSQKREDRVPHLLMFQCEVGLNDVDAFMEPALIGLRVRDDRRHAACGCFIHRSACR
jgi:hypothetical protein